MDLVNQKEIWALVAEGGGMRGIFCAGILDSFARQGFNPFSIYIGVSAGASCLASTIAGQSGRNYRLFAVHMRGKNILKSSRFLTGGSVMDLDLLWNSISAADPLDYPKMKENLAGKKFFAVATDCNSALPVYLDMSSPDCVNFLKASSALVPFYRKSVSLGKDSYVDGCYSDPLPVQKAIALGANRIVILRTRAMEKRKKKSLLDKAFQYLLPGNNSSLRNAFLNQAEIYNRCADDIENITKDQNDVQVFSLAPKELFCGRMTKDLEKINRDYESGQKAGFDFLASLVKK
jgi:predicted patatin/cPLA2 family phospholipase